MNLDAVTLGHILIVVARLLEMFSFGMVLLFVFKGVALKQCPFLRCFFRFQPPFPKLW